MNKNLQMVYTYHNETKHSFAKYARSLGYMDWDTQPYPYRAYKDTLKTSLKLSFDNVTPEYSSIFENNKSKKDIAPICYESISQFFQFSLGLSAIKEYGDSSWALRCNASSGNLHPSEAYIICQDIHDIPNGLHHYAPKVHHLELIAKSSKELVLPQNSFLICLSSITWREAWKYGERAWRYTQLDCGHALRSLEVSAFALGWKIDVINAKDNELMDLFGFNQEDRYIKEERELSDILILVSLDDKAKKDLSLDLKALRENLEKEYQGSVNELSKSWHKWEILEEIEDASLSNEVSSISFVKDKFLATLHRQKSYMAKDVILKRRSAQAMKADDSNISKLEFETLLASIKNDKSFVHLVLFVHNVSSLKKGLYILIRNDERKKQLQELFKDEFLWEKIQSDAGELYLLKQGDYKLVAKNISCSQDIAADGAFSLAMLCEFSEVLKKYDARVYKQLYWECGYIGQQLYLEARSLKLSATGIGCFLDDVIHNTLGLKTNNFQSLYCFTIGRALVDNRLVDKKPYIN